MHIYSYPALAPARRAGAMSAPPTPGVRSARFGNEIIVCADDGAEPAVAGVAAARGASRDQRLLRRHAGISREQLHVVVQNGRLFQQHHPEVPVLHDRGRFLLVQLAPAQARELALGQETCYGITPLRDGDVVFDTRGPTSARAPEPFVQAFAAQVDPARLVETVTTLVSFGTRHSESPGFTQAAAWAREQLTALGYQTTSLPVVVDGLTTANLVADQPDIDAGDDARIVIVTAHLDSINLAGGVAAPAPGADDNASGSAGVLEIARLFAAHRGANRLRLILFGGEEQGLFGSLRYVEGLAASERAKVAAVVNLDMIGSMNSPTRSVLLEGAALSVAIIEGLSAAASQVTQLEVETSLNPFASDHVPFINAGIAAVLVIEGSDNANQRVHSELDALEHIDGAFAAEIMRMVAGFVAAMLGSSR